MMLAVVAVDPWPRREKAMARTIRRRRLDAGLSQEGLAYAAGLSRNHVQKLERGIDALPNPTLRTLYALAEALGCRVIDLLPPDAH